MPQRIDLGVVDLSKGFAIVYDRRDRDSLGNSYKYLLVGVDDHGDLAVEVLSPHRPLDDAGRRFINSHILRHATAADLMAGYNRRSNTSSLLRLYYHAHFGERDASKHAALRDGLYKRIDFGSPAPPPPPAETLAADSARLAEYVAKRFPQGELPVVHTRLYTRVSGEPRSLAVGGRCLSGPRPGYAGATTSDFQAFVMGDFEALRAALDGSTLRVASQKARALTLGLE